MNTPAPTRVVTVCDREGDDWAMCERQHALADQVCLRIARVHLKAPAGATGHDSLPVIAVSITGDDPPEQIREPVNWLRL